MGFVDNIREWLRGAEVAPFGIRERGGGSNPAAYTELSGRPGVFDPALKHVRNGFRYGDPAVPADRRPAWREFHEAAVMHVARSIAASPIRENVVLRGGLAMRLWFGDRARRPRDLDFVGVPGDWKADSEEARALLDGVVAAVAIGPRSESLSVDTRPVPMDEIWTYERVEGRRLTFRCHPNHGPVGWVDVQVDVVFGEALGDPYAPLTLGDGGTLLAASQRESLAWKLFWLASDFHPQGKDLYDAVILAEAAAPVDEAELDRLIFATASLSSAFGPNLDPTRWCVATVLADLASPSEWDTFVHDYPEFGATPPEAWIARLHAALSRKP